MPRCHDAIPAHTGQHQRVVWAHQAGPDHRHDEGRTAGPCCHREGTDVARVNPVGATKRISAMSAVRDPEMWSVQLRTSMFHLLNLNLNSHTWRVATLCDSAVLAASSLTKPKTAEQHRTHQKVDAYMCHVSTTRFWRFSRIQGMGSISLPRPSLLPFILGGTKAQEVRSGCPRAPGPT